MIKHFAIFIVAILSVCFDMGDACAHRFRLQETVKPFSNYTQGNKHANGVFRIIDLDTDDVFYFKRTTQQEVDNTRRAEQIDFGPDPIIHIVQIADMDENQIEDITKSIGLVVPNYVTADTWMVTKKIPDGETLSSVIMNDGMLDDGTQIQPDEIDNMIRELKIMRNAGINHTDLMRNIFIYRDEDDKLRAYILDFENAGTRDTDFIENELNKLKNTIKFSE